MRQEHTMTTTHATLGMNRTGVSTSPVQTKQMLKGMEEFAPATTGDEGVIAFERVEHAKEAEPLGSVPPPTTVTGAAKTVAQSIRGESPTQFIDKLGERLAYERTGVRLYQALLSKYDAHGSFTGGPTREELVEHLEEEHRHMTILVESLTGIGADPTVMTPSADLQATMSSGILAVMVDPRTTLAQGLEAMLVVELADNDCWMALSQLANEAGETTLGQKFLTALSNEQKHLMHVRAWVAASMKLEPALSAARNS
jgi:hypothetical protein